MIYTVKHKMSQLLQDEDQALQLINRFGLPLGVGEKTIEEVCTENGLDSQTFVQVVNYALLPKPLRREDNPPSHRLHPQNTDTETLLRYIRNGHTYFLDFLLPRVRQELITAIGDILNGPDQIPTLIIRFFDEYVEEIRTHIEHENQNAFHLHQSDDQHIATKLNELKSLIIKYYPGQADYELFTALHDISDVKEELELHCAIEEDLLIPALQPHRHHHPSNPNTPDNEEELSSREKEVLQEVVKGLSNKEIADVLCISTHTVISHRKNIARKLNIHSVAGLTIYALVNGLTDLNNL